MTSYKALISDNASTTLATGIAANSPSMQVLAGSGALFPVLGTAQAFICTLIKNGAPTIREVVMVTGHSAGSDNFTGLVRNLSGTGALAWNAGDTVELRPEAVLFNSFFAQISDVQAQKTNYALDVGSANAYSVNLTPALNGQVIGMPIRWMPAHTNTGPCDLSDGISTAELLTENGAELMAGEVIAGLVHEAVFNGNTYQLSGRYRYSFAQINGSVSNLQVPQSAVVQYQAALSIGFNQLTGALQNGQIASSITLPGSPTTTTQSVGDNSTRIATTEFINKFLQRGSVHVGDVNSPVSGAVAFPHAFTSAPIVVVSLIDANNHGASAVAAIDGIPTTTGFNWTAREIASAVEDAYIHWIAVGS